VLLVFAAARAEAGTGPARRTCALVEADYFGIDGMIDDWKGIRYSILGGRDADASFDLYCAYDETQLYLALNVRDQRLIRTRQAKVKGEDHVTVRLQALGVPIEVTILPGALTAKPKYIAGRRRPAWLRIADSLQPKGFSVELALPRTKIPGASARTPMISAKVVFHDTDQATAHRIQRQRSFSGRLVLEGGVRTFKAFLESLKLKPGDVTLDKLADMDVVPGAERVVAGGRYVGVLSDQFAFMQLPVASAKDVKRLQLVDFDGDGRSFLVGQYRQYGGGGARDVVSVWEFKGDGSFRVVAAFEVGKELADARLSNRWTLVPRGSLRKLGKGESKRGFDLLVEAEPAVGLDASTWNEAPATDVHPILLPWSEETSMLYYFDGNVAHSMAPKEPGKRKRRK